MTVDVEWPRELKGIAAEMRGGDLDQHPGLTISLRRRLVAVGVVCADSPLSPSRPIFAESRRQRRRCESQFLGGGRSLPPGRLLCYRCHGLQFVLSFNRLCESFAGVIPAYESSGARGRRASPKLRHRRPPCRGKGRRVLAGRRSNETKMKRSAPATPRSP